MSGFDAIGPDSYRAIADLRQRVQEPQGDRRNDLALGDTGETSEFGSKLADALEGISGLSDEVKGKAEALARGEHVELHDLMISMGKSEVAFNMMLEVRNKLLEAWEKISRSAI